jgi:large subunit ribosomal protein L29
MKPSEIRERTDQELRELQQQLRQDLWKARFDNYSNQLDDTAKIRRMRRDLARIHTLRTQRTKARSEQSPESATTGTTV